MNAQTLRQAFLEYYGQHGHATIGAAPLVPEHDPSVLFTTAGMHPLIPYLLGAPHPAGVRLADVQPCLRTNDIDEVGDDAHLTLFEMLGAWSLGEYWKADALRLSYGFLLERLGLDPARIWVTCFAGDDDAPRDEEAAAIWRELGVPDERILFLPKSDNWWGPAGSTGPCGPDSEIFYDQQPDGPAGETPASNPPRFWEVGNNVFLQYHKGADGSFTPLAGRSVDLGMGFERLLPIVQGVPTVYDTDLFAPIIAAIRERSQQHDVFAERVVADHVRATTFVLAEGVRPGNTDQRYVVRRLIRRAVRYGRALGMQEPFGAAVAEAVIASLGDTYPLLRDQHDGICAALDEEEARFQRTLGRGERVLNEAITAAQERGETTLAGDTVFHLYDTYGFPAEMTAELAAHHGLASDMDGFASAFAAHQEQSRQGSAGRFGGGLSERNPATARLHTATHLLHAALRTVLGPHVAQRGSNITPERLRFDFSHGAKLTPEQIAAVEQWVNERIRADVPISHADMALDEAREIGAIGLFGERYGERVSVYTIGGGDSVEICGGPHAEHTGELGRFHITREQAVSAGVRRIRAELGN